MRNRRQSASPQGEIVVSRWAVMQPGTAAAAARGLCRAVSVFQRLWAVANDAKTSDPICANVTRAARDMETRC